MCELKNCNIINHHKIHVYEQQECKTDRESCVELEKQNSSKRNDAVVQPVVEHPFEDDRILPPKQEQG